MLPKKNAKAAAAEIEEEEEKEADSTQYSQEVPAADNNSEEDQQRRPAVTFFKLPVRHNNSGQRVTTLRNRMKRRKSWLPKLQSTKQHSRRKTRMVKMSRMVKTVRKASKVMLKGKTTTAVRMKVSQLVHFG